MELNVKKTKRNGIESTCFHKIPKCGATKCKAIASKDISKDSEMNYVILESKILEFGAYDFTYLNI